MKHAIYIVLLIFFSLLTLPRDNVLAQYAAGCQCLGNGNCADSNPKSQTEYCYTGDVLACGVQCPAGYKNVEMKCGQTSCGGKCVLDQMCVTGYCSSGSPTCNTIDGDFLCGSGGCGSCSRFVRETTCNGSQCQINCSADATCGAGCGGGVIDKG